MSVQYLSTGANRQTAVADWSRGGILAFGADVNIALWRPDNGAGTGIVNLLSSHKDHVKALRFLPEAVGDDSTYLVSGSDDKAVTVWKAPASGTDFKVVHTVQHHTAPINCISSLRLKGTSAWLIATGAADATIKVWMLQDDQLQLLQSIKTAPKYFPLALSLAFLDDQQDVAILAAAGTKSTVQIFTAETQSGSIFRLQATLTGHEGWIRSLSCTKESEAPNSDILIASASQDKYVRIWRVHHGKDLPPLAASGSDPSSDAFLPGKSPSNKAHKLNAAGKDFSITFEALLLGHEDWIYDARWHSHANGKPQLLTTSADNSLAIWEADPGSGIWVSTVRLGEISREKGATTATGSTGGFWTGLWSPDGRSVACLGRTGSWRRWTQSPEEDVWLPAISVSGHTKAVNGISWSKNGEYLLSTSSDQTTRLHTQWKGANTWHEMSRPQIHGYDLNCVDSLGNYQFVSGADEKLMRVFSKPKAVAAMLGKLGGISQEGLEDMPDAANMPVLGLSNKAVDTVADDEDGPTIDDQDREAMDPASIVKKSHLDIDHPPFEETLSRHTLWPETEKLYGHGYEISCLATSHDGTLVASACKASSANHGVIRLFETATWTEIRPPLTAHALTTTRLRFSRDDAYLLSVGRDRQWAVFARQKQDLQQYSLLQSNPKGHSRMILDAAWVGSGTVFATAGRDKQVKIWGRTGEEQFRHVASLACAAPVTAVDAMSTADGRLILAVGLENGRLSICSVNGETVNEVVVSPTLCLPKAILQLAWRPRQGSSELAIAGEDSSLRIYAFDELLPLLGV